MHYIIKNVKMTPVSNGYIICCDKYKADGRDEYDGMKYIGEFKLIAEEGEEAIKIVDELFAASVEGGEIELPESHGSSDIEPEGTVDLMKQT